MISDYLNQPEENEREAEERQEEIRLRQRRSRVAKRILMDADIMEVFSDMETECRTAFGNMGYGSTLEEYQAVHFSLMAISQLKTKLQGYITVNEIAEKNIEADKDFEGVQI